VLPSLGAGLVAGALNIAQIGTPPRLTRPSLTPRPMHAVEQSEATHKTDRDRPIPSLWTSLVWTIDGDRVWGVMPRAPPVVHQV
jgi:hypothetical protein